MTNRLVDTHAHLSDERFAESLYKVLLGAEAAGVCAIINAGYNLASSRAVYDLAQANRRLYAVVGIQPSDAPEALGSGLDEIEAMVKHSKVVGIGEIGLDYYWDKHPRDIQIAAFARQVDLAKSLGVPFVVHDREAHADVLNVIKGHAPFPAGFVMHCFSGSPEFAELCVAQGGYISIAGPVTFKNAVKSVKVAQLVPVERLLIETDCPYLAPHPHRGKTNKPEFLPLIAQRIAELRGMTFAEVAKHTTANAAHIFGLGEVVDDER